MNQPYKQRRTFAIISHPDAGKTTLTEKILLFGGAIHLAGVVRGKQHQRQTRSDWMDIEKKRGISVASSVMTFSYRNMTLNLLDTPGHQDFSDQTYQTLTAVDAAIMILDAAKGIEEQTLKLFEICRLYDMPIITLINKVDREGRDPVDLLEQITETLALDTAPLTWPDEMGNSLRGLYKMSDGTFESYAHQTPSNTMEKNIQLIQEFFPSFHKRPFLEGHLTPVFFGSALKNIGIDHILDFLVDEAPHPLPKKTLNHQLIHPSEEKVSGFVFKVQANMDPKHRDTTAFIRLCSGTFRRNMKLWNTRTQKEMNIHTPLFFFAQDRIVAEEAYAGDIIGIKNQGLLKIGDTLSESLDVHFPKPPYVAPEYIKTIRNLDPMKSKGFYAALHAMAEEGNIHFISNRDGKLFIGAAGTLQFDVLEERMKSEYKIPTEISESPFGACYFISADQIGDLQAFIKKKINHIAYNHENMPMFLAENNWQMNYIKKSEPQISFSKTIAAPL